MNRHPFAAIGSNSACEEDDVLDSGAERERTSRATSDSKRKYQACASSVPAKPKPCAKTEIMRRPAHSYSLSLEDSAFVLRLVGQEAESIRPVYGRAASVEGSITFVNSSNIIKAEVKMEGVVRVYEYTTGHFTKTTVMSELLVFWDAPNRLGGYGGEKNGSPFTGPFSPSPGSCPPTFTFKCNLPTHYTERDGSVTPLPPSFSDTMSGLQVDVCYEFVVYLIRVYDMRPIKSVDMCGKWRRKNVARHAFDYRPRSRPSRQGPFPPNSKLSSKSPITRFYFEFEPSPFYSETLKTLIYLPGSQFTPLCSPIQFYLKLYGPEWSISAFSQPDLSSFLPSPSSKSYSHRTRSICSIISDRMANLQFNISRLLEIGSSSLNGFTRFYGGDSGSLQDSFYEQSVHSDRLLTSSNSKVRVLLVREVSVDPSNEYGEDRANSGRVVKHMLLGEGTMYTADVTRESITWAGEVTVDPALDVPHGGFRTHSIVVQDLLLISIRDPTSEESSTFRQIVPLQLTTDPHESGSEHRLF